MLIEHELNICRSIDVKSPLFAFARTMSKWELLLTIANLDGNPSYGIWNYIDLLQTRTENPMTMYSFIKSKIDDGSFEAVNGDKKSRKTLRLSKELREALVVFLENRIEVVTPKVTNVVEADVVAQGTIFLSR